MVGWVSSWLNVVHGSGSDHAEDSYPFKDQSESEPASRRLSVQPMSGDLLPVGDHGYDIPDEFRSYHCLQDRVLRSNGTENSLNDSNTIKREVVGSGLRQSPLRSEFLP